MLALEGIRVLDLTRGTPGPYCTMVLGDLGAEVIRIEAVEKGGKGGGLIQSPKDEKKRRAAAFQAENRNKKSIGINLKSENGNRVFRELAKTADVVVDGFRPGVLERLKIDYKTISKINPKIIYCAITSYGQDGPYRDMIAHDLNTIGMAGALGIIGEKNRPPVAPMNLLADIGGSAKDAVIGIITALLVRQKTGRGQYVDISMHDSVVGLLPMLTTGFFRDGVPFKRGETHTAGAYPYYTMYQTKDGKYVTCGQVEPWIWERFCRVIGREDLFPCHFELDHLYYPVDEAEWGKMRASLKALFLTKTADEWWELMRDKDVCFGKVLTFEEVFQDPQVLHRKMLIEIDHPTAGKVKQVGIAIKLSETPGSVRSVAALFGEHTAELMGGLGYKSHDIEKLQKSGDIA